MSSFVVRRASVAALLLLAALPVRAAVPDPPSDRAHRFGVYAWGFETTAYPAVEGGTAGIQRIGPHPPAVVVAPGPVPGAARRT